MNRRIHISEIRQKKGRRLTAEDILFDWFRRFKKKLYTIMQFQRCDQGEPSVMIVKI
jgi:hypothetical protein